MGSKLQEKKQLVFDASIDGSAASLGKLTEQELLFCLELFVQPFSRLSLLRTCASSFSTN